MDTVLIAPEEIRNPIFTSYTFVHQTPEVISKPLPPITQHLVEHLLAHRSYSKTKLAKELHVSLVTINRWLNGTIKRPTHATFSKLLSLYCASKVVEPMIIEEAA